jgi:hypothetical protein
MKIDQKTALMSPASRQAFLLFIFALGFLLAAAPPVHAEDFRLFDGHSVVSIVYDNAGGAPIAKAAQLLAHDLNAKTGKAPVVSSLNRARGSAVIIGLAGSPRIAAILKANRLDASPIRGKWETYGRALIASPWNRHQKSLIIFGSDTRGAIWGVIDLTREMGVSAWEWWADVSIRKVDRITVSGAPYFSREPSVKYRGIFLNAGENGLNPWSGKTFEPEYPNMGPKTYARIFELMWRLKANTIWPAMTNADVPFNQIPENYQVLSDYAIVRGTSHVEMLLRNNSHEWNSRTMGPYNWLLNRDQMIRYWTGAVEKFGKYDNLYTVGLRNIDDFPMQGVSSPQQMAGVLSDVITQQRKILSDVLHRPAGEIPQVFTAYKEVLPAYDTGLLKLPDDITIDWPDDNFGYIRRLSNARERQRPGGSGVYYHNVFWGPPMSYLWLDATDPSLMWEEMYKAYKFDARQLWILNVGSIKPCEFMTQFFLDLAFDATAFEDSSSVHAYLQHWVDRTFGSEHAAEITSILWSYYKLAFDRNPEFMGWTEVFPETSIKQTEFNMLDFGDENARRVAAYENIMQQAKKLMAEMPDDRKAAFFQLVQYPVDASGDINIRQLSLDKSIAYGLQRRASANSYSARARQAQEQIFDDVRYYNDVMENGKWRYMMSAVPHALPIYEVPHLPAWGNDHDNKCGVQVEGGAFFDQTGWWTPTLPPFHPELRNQRYIDIFVQGAVAAKWTATPSAPWIKVSRTAGGFSPATNHFEDRVEVSIDWSAAPPAGKGAVTVNCSTALQPIPVHVELASPNQVKNVSFIEADRIVSIYATHADQLNGTWEILDGLGHTGASLRTRLDMPSVDAKDPAAILKAPRAIYRFATSTTDDTAALRVMTLPMFPITSENRLRLAVSLDGASPTVLDFDAPEFSQAWRQHVLTNEAIELLPDLRLAPGAHELTLYALDPGIILDRIELAFTGAPRAYLPVPETRITH